jgi:FkbM family methyltransferase
MFNREKIKQALIGLGIYRPVRRIYDKFNPTRAGKIGDSHATFSTFVKPGDLCFDVGANVGAKSESMLKIGARVLAIEPQPSCLSELRALYGGNPNFTVVPKAVGSGAGTAKMHVSSHSALSSLRKDWFETWDGEIEVEITTLDALIAEYGVPSYIKMDIEGFELEALKGLTRPVHYVSFEFNNRFVDQAIACIDYLSRFGSLRFNLSLMEDSHLLNQDSTWWNYDALMRRFREELERNPENWGGDIYVRIEQAAPNS